VGGREFKEMSRRDFLAASLGLAFGAVAACGSEENGGIGSNSTSLYSQGRKNSPSAFVSSGSSTTT
jgi:hypothetical protein